MLISSSSRYSIYKVQWSVLISLSLTRTFISYHILKLLSRTFFKVFDFRLILRYPLFDSFSILPHSKPFVKHFFRLFPNFLSCVFQLIRYSKQLLHDITFHSVCQELFHFFSTDPSRFIILSPPLRTACIYYHRPNYLSSTLTKFLIIFYRLHTNPPELTLRGWWLYYYI